MKSKYNMSVQDNIFFAKRKEIDNVYCSAILENIKVSFEEVEAFYNNVNTGNISIDDMLKLKGLEDCWEMVLGSIEEPLTMDYIKKVHFEICKGQSVSPLGEYRDYGVGITGTNWRPKLPSECDYDKELANIMKIDSPIDRCITLFCWIQRSQMFKDGNKRVANLVANKEMIKNGQGIIAIPVDKIGQYFSKLINFYETDSYENIKKRIYTNVIDGV